MINYKTIRLPIYELKRQKFPKISVHIIWKYKLKTIDCIHNRLNVTFLCLLFIIQYQDCFSFYPWGEVELDWEARIGFQSTKLIIYPSATQTLCRGQLSIAD